MRASPRERGGSAATAGGTGASKGRDEVTLGFRTCVRARERERERYRKKNIYIYIYIYIRVKSIKGFWDLCRVSGLT